MRYVQKKKQFAYGLVMSNMNIPKTGVIPSKIDNFSHRDIAVWYKVSEAIFKNVTYFFTYYSLSSVNMTQINDKHCVQKTED